MILMKRAHCLPALAAFLLLAACAVSPTVGERLTATWNAAVADGVISPEEAESIRALLTEQGESIDWPQTIGTGIATLVTSFFGVNLYRNRREAKVWGLPDKTQQPSTVPSSPA